jgi:hypothetical protein
VVDSLPGEPLAELGAREGLDLGSRDGVNGAPAEEGEQVDAQVARVVAQSGAAEASHFLVGEEPPGDLVER